MSPLSTKIEPGPAPYFLLKHITDPDLCSSLQQAAVIILPEAQAEDGTRFMFRPDTGDVARYLAEEPSGILSVEIASTDDEYAELALHGAELWLPTLLFASTNAHAINLTIGVLSNYIYDRIRGYLDREVRVHSKIYVNAQKGTLSVTYDGPADSFERIMKGAFEKISAEYKGSQ